MVITGLTGHWWPDRIVRPGLELAAAVALIAALSLLGSVFLSSTANGIAIFMVFGAGLVAGLLGTIGHALASHTLERAAKIAAYVVPVEALYQDALQGITADQRGLTKFVLELGPFGGAYTGGVGPRSPIAGVRFGCRTAPNFCQTRARRHRVSGNSSRSVGVTGCCARHGNAGSNRDMDSSTTRAVD